MERELEVIEFMEKTFKEKTFTDKTKRKLLLWKTPDSEIDKMREQLIKEAKPIFINHRHRMSGKNKDKPFDGLNKSFDDLTIEYFDERIRSLPKEYILELFDELQYLKKTKSKEAREIISNLFVTNITVLYSLEGWFRRKLVNILTQTCKQK
jgi:hypothetical protein